MIEIFCHILCMLCYLVFYEFLEVKNHYWHFCMLCHFVFDEFLEVKNRFWHSMHVMLKIVFINIHMNCLLGFRKMTFTIHLLFASLAGMIFRPWFTTFCSCNMFCLLSFSKKNTFFMLIIWYCNWCLMIFFSRNFFSRIHCYSFLWHVTGHVL